MVTTNNTLWSVETVFISDILLAARQLTVDGVDDKIAKVLWMKSFLEWQGFAVKLNIIYQDNISSTIRLEENGKESWGNQRNILTSNIST
jgi:arginine exporter protein ArgO